jgi:hypothetical protein
MFTRPLFLAFISELQLGIQYIYIRQTLPGKREILQKPAKDLELSSGTKHPSQSLQSLNEKLHHHTPKSSLQDSIFTLLVPPLPLSLLSSSSLRPILQCVFAAKERIGIVPVAMLEPFHGPKLITLALQMLFVLV